MFRFETQPVCDFPRNLVLFRWLDFQLENPPTSEHGSCLHYHCVQLNLCNFKVDTLLHCEQLKFEGLGVFHPAYIQDFRECNWVRLVDRGGLGICGAPWNLNIVQFFVKGGDAICRTEKISSCRTCQVLCERLVQWEDDSDTAVWVDRQVQLKAERKRWKLAYCLN